MSQSLEKKLENLSSSCFSQEFSSEVLKTGKRLTRDGSFESLGHGLRRVDTPTKDRLRPSDHSPSDLFGSSTPDLKSSKPLYPDSKTPEKSLKSSENHSKHNSSTPRLIPKPSQMTVKTFELSGLASKSDYLAIKDLCKGFHVIKINPGIDNVTGTCNGMAEVQVRTSEKSQDCENFQLQMVSKGLFVKEVQEKHGIKNNRLWTKRNFLDPGLQREEKRPNSHYMKSDERKKASLATSPDLLASNSGIRLDRDDVEKTKLFIREDKMCQESLRKWESVKCLEKRAAVTPIKGFAGYLKSTISSQNKGKGK